MEKFKPVTPRLPEKTIEWLDATFKNPTAGAGYVVDAFRAMYARVMYDLRGRFTPSELSLILDVFNGMTLTPAIAGQHLSANCVDGMELDALDEKWGVNRRLFTEKLRGLTLTDAACLEIWANSYWYTNNDLPDFDGYIAALAEIIDPIQRTKTIARQGYAIITNPLYLESKFAEMSIDEIKAMPKDENGQLPPDAQRELSLRGDRLSFLQFHRFMYQLPDDDIKKLWKGKAQYAIEKKVHESGYTFCDLNILTDATQYQLCIRDEKRFDPMVTDEIALSFRQNVEMAKNFPEIDSQHMIGLVNEILRVRVD